MYKCLNHPTKQKIHHLLLVSLSSIIILAHYYSSSAILAAIRFYLLFSLFVGMVSARLLSPFFYARTCPNALTTFKSAVDSAVSSEPHMEHPCCSLFTFMTAFQCDASVLLDDTTNFIGEKTAFPNNNSLRGFDVIDTIKSQLENMCPGVVSCADIVTVAARDSVVALGGPRWPLLLGRRDYYCKFNAFSNKGFTAQEMVVLSG
uniref:peroxidase n=1 Tax=Quercus lobata TaxID=97700 RepID=A0A7N2M5L0_QUELO